MDPYVYPGTGVLRNLRDIRDVDDLATFEADATGARLKELENKPVPGSFNGKHLRAIHRYVFQDVYAWAGSFRTVDIARPGQFYFAFANRIEPSLSKVLGDLRQENRLKGLDAQAFSTRAGHYLAEINAIHPFRDGNGRAQREFIRTLAAQNGHTLRWSRVTPAQMFEASRLSFQRGDSSSVVALLRTALE